MDGDLDAGEPRTFDWQAGGATDKTWGGKSRIWIEDKPGQTRSLQANKTLAVYGDTGCAGDRCVVDPSPDSPRYAACGDAVTVNVAEWIGRRLTEFE